MSSAGNHSWLVVQMGLSAQDSCKLSVCAQRVQLGFVRHSSWPLVVWVLVSCREMWGVGQEILGIHGGVFFAGRYPCVRLRLQRTHLVGQRVARVSRERHRRFEVGDRILRLLASVGQLSQRRGKRLQGTQHRLQGSGLVLRGRSFDCGL